MGPTAVLNAPAESPGVVPLEHTAGERLVGLQTAGLFNVAGQALDGLQVGGLFNAAGERLDGLQVAGLFNVAGEQMIGWQVAALMNVVGQKMGGVQLAALLNVVGDRLRGVQLSAGYNRVGADMSGVQIGLMNVGAEVRGLQLGLVNVARRMHGVQLGLVNIADASDAAIGAVSIIKGAPRWVEVWADDQLAAHAGVRLGGRIVTSLVGVAVDPLRDGTPWGPLAGAGVRIPVVPAFEVLLDAVLHVLFVDGGDEVVTLLQVRARAALQLGRLVITAGPTWNVETRADEDARLSFGGTAGVGVRF